MIDNLLGFIERVSGGVHNWAWTRRRRDTDPGTWIKEYRKWKKTRCPHN